MKRNLNMTIITHMKKLIKGYNSPLYGYDSSEFANSIPFIGRQSIYQHFNILVIIPVRTRCNSFHTFFHSCFLTIVLLGNYLNALTFFPITSLLLLKPKIQNTNCTIIFLFDIDKDFKYCRIYCFSLF